MVYSYISSVRIVSPHAYSERCKEIAHGLIIRTIRYFQEHIGLHT